MDFSRERDAEAENRSRPVAEKVDTESHLVTPRVVRRPRRSIQVEGATTLTDFMQQLQVKSDR